MRSILPETRQEGSLPLSFRCNSADWLQPASSGTEYSSRRQRARRHTQAADRQRIRFSETWCRPADERPLSGERTRRFGKRRAGYHNSGFSEEGNWHILAERRPEHAQSAFSVEFCLRRTFGRQRGSADRHMVDSAHRTEQPAACHIRRMDRRVPQSEWQVENHSGTSILIRVSTTIQLRPRADT